MVWAMRISYLLWIILPAASIEVLSMVSVWFYLLLPVLLWWAVKVTKSWIYFERDNKNNTLFKEETKEKEV